MFFSLISPDPTAIRQAAYAGPQSRYAEHQWLWRFFPDQAEQPRDFVYRRHEAGEGLRYYLISPEPPHAPDASWRVQSKAYAPIVQAGSCLAFELCANPVVNKKDASGKSRRHDVVMQAKKQLLQVRGLAKWSDWQDDDKPALYELVQEQCASWLHARAAKHGFEIVQVRVDAYTNHSLRKPGSEREIAFSTVELSGILRVTDAVLFQQVLLTGLGHAKGFGCGLLLVKRCED